MLPLFSVKYRQQLLCSPQVEFCNQVQARVGYKGTWCFEANDAGMSAWFTIPTVLLPVIVHPSVRASSKYRQSARLISVISGKSAWMCTAANCTHSVNISHDYCTWQVNFRHNLQILNGGMKNLIFLTRMTRHRAACLQYLSFSIAKQLEPCTLALYSIKFVPWWVVEEGHIALRAVVSLGILASRKQALSSIFCQDYSGTWIDDCVVVLAPIRTIIRKSWYNVILF